MIGRRRKWPQGDVGLGLGFALVVVLAFVAFITIDPRYSWSRLLDRDQPAGSSGPVAVTARPSPELPTPQLPSRTRARATNPSPTVGSRATPGIDATFTPRADGSFDVVERITQAGAGGSVTLTPPSPQGAGAEFSRTRARVFDLHVTTGADRLLGSVPAALTRTVARPVLTGGSSMTVVLVYRLAGTTVDGRAWLTPLTIRTDRALPAVVRLAGRPSSDATSGPVVVSLATSES